MESEHLQHFRHIIQYMVCTELGGGHRRHSLCGGSEDIQGGNAFYKINLSSKAVVATLTAWPYDSNDYFPQMVHDTRRNKLVLFGSRVLEYNLATESPSQAWEDVTPSGWPGFRSPMGVYHPTMDAIYFRGAKIGGTRADGFEWHMMKFDSGGTVIRVPSKSRAEAAHAVSPALATA